MYKINNGTGDDFVEYRRQFYRWEEAKEQVRQRLKIAYGYIEHIHTLFNE